MVYKVRHVSSQRQQNSDNSPLHYVFSDRANSYRSFLGSMTELDHWENPAPRASSSQDNLHLIRLLLMQYENDPL